MVLGPEALAPSVLAEINSMIERAGLAQVRQAWQRIFESYKDLHGGGKQAPIIADDLNVLAYGATRMISTAGVVAKVLSHLPAHAPIHSCLDLGAGTGAATHAALCQWASLREVTLLDQSQGMLNFAEIILNAHPLRAQIQGNFVRGSLTDPGVLDTLEEVDVSICSYALHELGDKDVETLLEKVWAKTRQYIIIIEPGTSFAFQSFLRARSQLLTLGGHVVAPCPHGKACPLGVAEIQDWCHFNLRQNRPHFYQQIKGGTQGYGDDKYTYGIFAKDPTQKSLGNAIIARPRKASGHVLLDLCTPDGLKEITISRKHKQAYKSARQREWGDFWSDYEVID